MAAFIVYVTTGSHAEARQLGQIAVEEGLAACANIIEQLGSIYRWEGKVEEANETLLLLKTGERRLPALIDRLKALHQYDLPCITAIPIAGGNPDYLEWIEAETGGSASG